MESHFKANGTVVTPPPEFTTTINFSRHISNHIFTPKKLPTLRLTFWNINGFKNLYHYTPPSIPDILALTETWLQYPITSYPSSFHEFLSITVEAKKDHFSNPGRASGGLALCYHNSLEAEIINTSDCWIFAKFERKSTSPMPTKFVVGLIYLKPALGQNLGPIITELQQTLEMVDNIRLNEPLYIGGDFNAWIGSDCTYPDELLEGTVFSSVRTITESTENQRGISISNFMIENGLLLLNGRSPGDTPARVTYVGPRGNSAIDFVFSDLLNLHLIHDFSVEQSVLPSDHLPVTLELSAPSRISHTLPNSRDQSPRLKWNSTKFEKYFTYLKNSPTLHFDPNADSDRLMGGL